MNKIQFNEDLRKYGPRIMLGRYINDRIELNSHQLNSLIRLKNIEEKFNEKKRKVQVL